jgi:hypothetical protein
MAPRKTPPLSELRWTQRPEYWQQVMWKMTQFRMLRLGCLPKI